MIKILSISKQEQKVDNKGEACINYQCKIQTKEGLELSAYITSYGGQLNAGDSIDCKIEEKHSQKTGKAYYSGYYRPSKTNMTPVQHEPTPQFKDYTFDELEKLYFKVVKVFTDHSTEIATIPVESTPSMINSLFISMVQRGIRANDRTEL